MKKGEIPEVKSIESLEENNDNRKIPYWDKNKKGEKPQRLKPKERRQKKKERRALLKEQNHTHESIGQGKAIR